MTIMISHLPPTLWRKEAVRNEIDCNYEIYLTEFINNSPKFMEVTNNRQVHHCSIQSDKEWDCYLDETPFLDFKLLGSQSMQQAIGDTAMILESNGNGVYDINQPELTKKEYYGYYLHMLFREKTVKNLFSIEKENANNKELIDIKSVLKILKTNKDCLYLFLDYFWSPDSISFKDLEEGALSYFRNWLPELFKYRDCVTENRKTYLAFMLPQFKKMIVYKWESENLLHFDSIDFNKSENFTKYLKITPIGRFMACVSGMNYDCII